MLALPKVASLPRMGLGDMAKKWAKDKATELLSADSAKSDAAGSRADDTEREARSSVGEQLLRTAFPKLGEMTDEQDEKNRKAAEDSDRERREEIASLPVAQVQLSFSGWATGQWSGPMHYGWNEIAADERDPTHPDPDPYAAKKLLWFELFAPEGEGPRIDGHELVHWSFQIAGWIGDGTYDLTAIAQEREAAGWSSDYLEWALDFSDAEDMTFYFHTGSGPSSATVADDTSRFSVSINTSGAYGDLTAAAEITLR
jgi:hypothetical protein